MITHTRFYGGAFALLGAGDTAPIGAFATVDLTAAQGAHAFLPAPAPFPLGGPHARLYNRGPGSVDVKVGSTTVTTLAANRAAVLLRAPSGWKTITKVLSGTRTFGSTTADRALTIGAPAMELPPIVIPTDPVPVVCKNAFYPVRVCGTGAWANLWLASTAITFTAGVFVFLQNSTGKCLYVLESDTPRQSPPADRLVMTGDLTATDDCTACLADHLSHPCPDGLLLPDTIWVRFEDVDRLDTEDRTGRYRLRLADLGGTLYELVPGQLPEWYFIQVWCTGTGEWHGKFGYDLTSSPGGGGVFAWNEWKNPTTNRTRPAVGEYSDYVGGDGGYATGCVTTGCWAASSFLVF